MAAPGCSGISWSRWPFPGWPDAVPALPALLVLRSPQEPKQSDVSLNATQSASIRDSIAKFIYTRMFDWLITIVNDSLAGEEGP